MSLAVALDAPAATVATACRRIEEVDTEIGAWVCLDPTVDTSAPDTPEGSLTGWPIGIKDLIDVAGLPTRAGSILGADAPDLSAAVDSALVARLRAAGATILGKTAAVEYGWFGKVTTRNPHDLTRSPGGSSSGSAAAVAAGMCRAAIGTQTAGSVIRPAAYSGVPALKFSHGVLDMTGVVPVSEALDVVGVFAATIEDIAAAARVLLCAANDDRSQSHVRIGVLVHEFGDVCDPDLLADVARAISALGESDDIELRTTLTEVDWSALRTAHRMLMLRECALSRQAEFERRPDQFSPVLQDAIREGLALDDSVRVAAHETAARAQAQLDTMRGIDVWLTPGATHEPPAYGRPGDPSCQTPFSLLGLPAVHLPLGPGRGGLPIGLQLVGRPGGDLSLVGHARTVAAALAAGQLPHAADVEGVVR